MRTILVIDDDDKIVELVKDFLTGLGYSVTGATEVYAAMLEAAKSPDLVILDYQMPGGGGLEVLKNLRSMTPTEKVPVLFLSATPKFEIMFQVEENPLVDFLEKPIDFDLLKSRVAEMLAPRP